MLETSLFPTNTHWVLALPSTVVPPAPSRHLPVLVYSNPTTSHRSPFHHHLCATYPLAFWSSPTQKSIFECGQNQQILHLTHTECRDNLSLVIDNLFPLAHCKIALGILFCKDIKLLSYTVLLFNNSVKGISTCDVVKWWLLYSSHMYSWFSEQQNKM